MPKTILLDCDDVLLNWLDGFRKYCASKLGKEICDRGPKDWVMDEWLGTEPHETIQLIQEFNSSEEFGNLDPVKGAPPILKATALHTQVRMHVITSCSSDWDTVEMRKANLKQHYGDIFDSVHCLDLGQPKDKILHSFSPCVWFEDNIKHALAGVRFGHKVFMRQTSHNLRHKEEAEAAGITWFDDWRKIHLAAIAEYA